MAPWKMMSPEPTLDELLDDEIMREVMRSAGTDAAGLKAALARTARRLSGGTSAPIGGRRQTGSVELCCG